MQLEEQLEGTEPEALSEESAEILVAEFDGEDAESEEAEEEEVGEEIEAVEEVEEEIEENEG